MTNVPPARPSAALHIEPDPTRFSRRNYWIFVAEGGLFTTGVAFVSQDSVLPGIVRQLGGSDAVLALIPMLMMVGFTLPPLFTSGWMERQGRLLPVVRFFGVLQRLPYLLAALALWGLGSESPRIALTAVVACPLLSGLMGGITLSGWLRLTSRTVPGNRRSSGSALRSLISSVMGIVAGLFAEWILGVVPPLQAYALLHAVAFGFLTLSYIVFLFTDEPHMPKPPREAHHSFMGQFGRMRMILREDGEFRTYLMARVLGTTVFATVPYMAVTALEVTGRPDAFTGRLLAFQMSGAILGNLLGGWWGDTLGSRRVLISARSSFMLSCACLLLLPTALGFCLAFLLWGMTRAQQVIGEQTFLVEISKGRPMPAYVGIASLAQLLSVLAMAGISLQLRKWFPGILPVALFSLAGMVGSVWLLKTRVREPRGSR